MAQIARVPHIIDWHRDACNGMYPSATYYAKIVGAQNHITAHRHREVYALTRELGNGSYGYSGTTTISRFRFRSGYGAKIARVVMILGRDNTGGVAASPSAKVTVGGTDVGPFYYGQSAVATDDEPSNLSVFSGTISITPATVYECSVTAVDYARVMGVSVHEIGESTVDETTNYFSSWRPGANTPIYDAPIGRILEGLSKTWRQNGGTVAHWGRINGAARTRSAASALNLIDGTSTTPSASTPGWTLDMRYRNSQRRTTVPIEFSVYGSVAGGGSGTVSIVDSSGTAMATATISSGTAQWFTATGTLPATVAKYDLVVTGDGANTTSVYAVSLAEYEA